MSEKTRWGAGVTDEIIVGHRELWCPRTLERIEMSILGSRYLDVERSLGGAGKGGFSNDEKLLEGRRRRRGG